MLIKTIITDALQNLGVTTMGEEMTPQEHQQGLRVFNSLVDSYNSQNLLIFHTVTLDLEAPQTLNPCSVPDSANTVRKWKPIVTIGDCEDYNMIAPTHITMIGLIDTLSGTTKILNRITIEESINPSTTSPSGVWVEIGEKKATLSFNGLPKEEEKLKIICKIPYRGSLEDGSYSNYDDVNFDYGVERMLRLNLTVELASYYGVNLPSITILKAQDALQELKDKAFLIKPLSLDAPLIRRGN